jgi:predicted negative regulator of RcsB-dependent stress response
MQRLRQSSVESWATHHRRATLKSLVIGALIVAVVVLGYLYWDSRNNTIFKAPGIEIKKNP